MDIRQNIMNLLLSPESIDSYAELFSNINNISDDDSFSYHVLKFSDILIKYYDWIKTLLFDKNIVFLFYEHVVYES